MGGRAAQAREVKLRADTFLRGSCFDTTYGLPRFAHDSIDHVCTDPPYAEYVHGIGSATKHHADLRYRDEGADFDFAHFTAEDRQRFAEQVVRVTRSWALIFTDFESVGAWVEALQAAGAKKHSTMVWTKSNAAPKFAGNGPAQAAEAIVTAWCGKGGSRWNAGGAQGHYHYPFETRDRRHRTQKPLPLLRQLLIDFTEPGDLVLDPFAGGGSTLIAAAQLHRRYLGFEIADTPETKFAYDLGMDMLARVRPFTRGQQVILHRERKRRAYAGENLSTQIAAMERYIDLSPRPPRKARDLDDVG